MFVKFDPQAFFENDGDRPAKAAKPPKVLRNAPPTLAALGTLAGPGCENPKTGPAGADDPDDPERAAIIDHVVAFPDVPAEWIAGVDRLQRVPLLPGWKKAEWGQLEADATTFLTTWAAQAHALGWSALDFFGVHPRAPRTRYDCMGLVLMLGGRSVLAMDDRTARISVRDGVTHSFTRRQGITEAVLIWELFGGQGP